MGAGSWWPDNPTMTWCFLISAYALIIGALWFDFAKVRKVRREYQMEMLKKHPKEAKKHPTTAAKNKIDAAKEAEREAAKAERSASAIPSFARQSPKRRLKAKRNLNSRKPAQSSGLFCAAPMGRAALSGRLKALRGSFKPRCETS